MSTRKQREQEKFPAPKKDGLLRDTHTVPISSSWALSLNSSFSYEIISSSSTGETSVSRLITFQKPIYEPMEFLGTLWIQKTPKIL